MWFFPFLKKPGAMNTTKEFHLIMAVLADVTNALDGLKTDNDKLIAEVVSLKAQIAASAAPAATADDLDHIVNTINQIRAADQAATA